MSFSLEIKSEANLDLVDILHYYDAISITLGNKFIANWEASIKAVCKNPMGFEIKKNNFQQARIKTFPYLIIFETLNGSVIVYAIIHAKKSPSKRYRR